MRLKTKIYLADDSGEKFMGIGVLWLLKAIEEHGSLRKGAAELSISYSKAYGMISSLEKNLGVPVIDRRKGGNEHTGAMLTPFGKEFLALYEEFHSHIKKLCASPYLAFSDTVQQLIDSYRARDKE